MTQKFKLKKEMLLGEGERVLFMGTALDTPEELHIARTGKTLKFVVQKGYIDDFAIYVENPYNEYYSSFEQVLSNGDKLPRYQVRDIIDVDDETLKKYRD